MNRYLIVWLALAPSLWGADDFETDVIETTGGDMEITFVGQPNPVIKHRRDFLTGGLVDRAISEASREACREEWLGAEMCGLSTEGLMRALDGQVRHVVDQLNPGNCEQYLSLPDAMRVGSVRRIPQAPVLPIQLERAH